ncbi:MAG: glycogen synthase GlgA [Paracoccaceae bacterium]
MKLLAVASEAAPFIKTGGLADVVGALPKALAAEGVAARTLLPLYPALRPLGGEEIARLPDLPGGGGRVLFTRQEGIDLYLLDAPQLFNRPGNPYLGQDGADWPDNHLRFAALSRAGAALATGADPGWRPNILHAHDWQAGLAPTYLRAMGATTRTVITIHNIAFQGLFPADTVAPLGLSLARFTRDAFEFWGHVGFLKAGLIDADRITTVSPTYARELAEPAFGHGLEGVIAARRADLVGVLNGIDEDVWNPATDPAIAAPFSVRAPSGKARNKTTLAAEFRLEPGAGPLFVVISRLTGQKGFDLLLPAVEGMMARGARLAVIGTGEPALEQAFRSLAARYPGRVAVRIDFDEPLSHRMQAGADAIIVPSRFEPCGLTQLCALRYGTLPVVARTGGLADTVVDLNAAALATGAGTGFHCTPGSAPALEAALHRCLDLYEDRGAWTGAVRRAMRQPVGWSASAHAYAELFKALLS